MLVRAACIAASVLVAPAAAMAQARNGNVYDGTAHEPNPGVVHRAEKSAGIAPSQQTVQSDDQELQAIGRQLTNQANQDAQAAPRAGENVYGVAPGGVVPITPGAGLNGAAGPPAAR
ncbi:MAG TPA: hypothetical protein VHS58_12340 [Acetobacteraceae bacterium]|jgi:hypothetical protein|nr:hypothetical protein [Acetobacteraceae bacterium]